MKIREIVLWIALALLAYMSIKDDLRLVQVRQQLMDNGTPIEMDK